MTLIGLTLAAHIWEKHRETDQDWSEESDDESQPPRSCPRQSNECAEAPRTRHRRERSHRENKTAETPVQGITLPDHYRTLGILPTASAEEIREAAKKRRIESHPDRLKREPDLTEARLREIDDVAKDVAWAAEVLMDWRAKERYDKQYHALLK